MNRLTQMQLVCFQETNKNCIKNMWISQQIRQNHFQISVMMKWSKDITKYTVMKQNTYNATNKK